MEGGGCLLPGMEEVRASHIRRYSVQASKRILLLTTQTLIHIPKYI